MRLISDSGRRVLRILAVSRRSMLIGVLALILNIFVVHINVEDIINAAWPIDGLYNAILFFFSVSPLAYLLLLLFSTFYIRKYGQSADIESERPFIVSLLSCMFSDITAPFRLVISFFKTMFGKAPEYYPDELWEGSKRIYTFRLIMALLWFALYFFGIQIVIWNI